MPMLAAAQTQEEQDKGYIVSLIEDNLSSVSSDVNIMGFAGALSSQATIDVLTVADADGVWLTLEKVVLEWNRGALLRGRIDVQELSAQRIIVARPPVSEDTGPSPEAQPFSLPELPVGISLGLLNIDRIELGAGFLGEPLALSLTGTAQLSGGEGSANVVARRLDAQMGVFEIDGNYANTSRVLGLKLKLEEGEDGIAARILDLPGRPSVRLAIDGTAPLDDYAATLAIATAGQDRVTGTFGLQSRADGRLVRLDVGGDVTPLFAPEYRSFFGDNVRLRADARQFQDGRIDISALDLKAQRVNLAGALVIGATGWPERINLTGGIAASEGEPVLLPLSGPQTFVDAATLTVSYDAALADDWQADIGVIGFDRPGLLIRTIGLQGGGILRLGEGDLIGQVTANLRYSAKGLVLDDAGASEALGDEISGVFAAQRTEGDPLQITRFTLGGAGIDASATATIAGPRTGLSTQAEAQISVDALGRFSTLVGQPLGGGVEISAQIDAAPLNGLFDLTLTGSTRDLAVGIAEADAVLAGAGSINAKAVRDTTGTRLETLRVQTDAAALTAEAALTSQGSTASFDAQITEVAKVLPGITGPARLTGALSMLENGVVQFNVDGTGPAVSFTANGTANPAETGQTINMGLTAALSDLSVYADLAGRPLRGAATLDLGGVLQSDGLRFDLDVDGTTTDLTVGIAQLDPLLRGAGVLSGGLAGTAPDSFRLSDLTFAAPELTARADGELRLDGPVAADIDLAIRDAAVLDPSLSRPITLSLDAARQPDDHIKVDLIANGPGAAITLDAQVAPPGDNYEITGDMSVKVDDLAAYRVLVGQPVAGSVTITASGSILPDLSRFEAKIGMQSQDLAIGNPTVDPLLRGKGRINTSLALSDSILSVTTLEATTPQLSFVGALNGRAGVGQGRFNASLRDVGVLTDQISGPVRATGAASLDDAGNWGIDASGTGPGGLQAQAKGTIGQDLRMNLDINGSAPLALANAALDPRRISGTANFDLRVDGPPQVSSLNGRITVTGARLAAPTLAQALENLGGQVTLNAGNAQLDFRANVESGGRITVIGPVGLNAPNNADITARFADVVLTDRKIYTTRLSGAITLSGPLENGARIAGRLDVGQTDIQVPSSSISTLGELPSVIHVGERTAVRQTLQRAGVDVAPSGKTARAGLRRSYPLNIIIDAPSRIFIRGRGLDAELGGRLTIGGTTDNVIPVGRFDLLRGRIDILQQRFELTEGTASLQGSFEPYIRLVALTESTTGTMIRIIIEGPASGPEVRFESTPELPQDEVLSQLIFGRSLENISPLQAIQLASAVSTLAGSGGGAIDRLRRNVGLDDFDVTTDEEGTAAVRAGKYLSEDIYTDVTVTSEGGTEINLNLDLTDQITAKGSVDQDGNTSVGLFFERNY